MIELAAVAGPRFELRVLAEAAGLDHGALVSSVEEAVRMGMIEELPEPQPACRFTHELVRRAVYDRIPRVRLPELHLRVGEALERIHADDARVLPELAHHFTLAAPLAGVERGVEYNLRAAEAATATLAYDEAAARLSSALELGHRRPSERARVQAELGLLLYHTGRTGESEAILSASVDAATEPGGAGSARCARSFTARPSGCRRTPRSARQRSCPLPRRRSGRSSSSVTRSAWRRPRSCSVWRSVARVAREESFAALERALAHAEAAGDQVLRRDVIGRMALWLCGGTTPAGEAIERLDGLRALARDDPVLDAGLCRCRALLLAMAGRFDEANEHIAGQRPDPRPRRPVASLAAQPARWSRQAKELAGDLAGAKQDVLTAFLSMRDARGEGSEARALKAAAELALLCCDQGEWDEAAEYLSYGRQVDESEPPRGKAYAFLRLAARARLAAHRGEPAEALELARRAVELAEPRAWLNHTARVWLALAEVQRVNGHNAEADAAVADGPSPLRGEGERRRDRSPSGERGLNVARIDNRASLAAYACGGESPGEGAR